jgi:hypothetical protein
MRLVQRIVAAVLLPTMLTVSSPVLAQQIHVVDSAAMSRALAVEADAVRAKRDVVRRVLNRADVRKIAESMGLSVDRAQRAIATLDAAELTEVARHAANVEAAAMSGGANTIVISTTTVILVLLIVILLLVAN